MLCRYPDRCLGCAAPVCAGKAGGCPRSQPPPRGAPRCSPSPWACSATAARPRGTRQRPRSRPSARRLPTVATRRASSSVRFWSSHWVSLRCPQPLRALTCLVPPQHMDTTGKLALHFTLSCEHIPTTLVSTASLSRLQSNLAAVHETLSAEETALMDELRRDVFRWVKEGTERGNGCWRRENVEGRRGGWTRFLLHQRAQQLLPAGAFAASSKDASCGRTAKSRSTGRTWARPRCCGTCTPAARRSKWRR